MDTLQDIMQFVKMLVTRDSLSRMKDDAAKKHNPYFEEW